MDIGMLNSNRGLSGSLLSRQSRQDLGALKVSPQGSTHRNAVCCSCYLPCKAEELSRAYWI